MVYYASSGLPPSTTAEGPVTYRNPYYNAGCGCGSAVPALRRREGLEVSNGNGLPPAPAPAPAGAPGYAPPMCTLTATAPPAGCCHPAPLLLVGEVSLQ